MTVKTYLITNQYLTDFPPDFRCSKNERYIIVQQCKCIYKDFLVGDVELHADFIERQAYCDHMCIYCNEIRTKYKKYRYTGDSRNFRIWFTLMDGTVVEPQHFKLELLLIY